MGRSSCSISALQVEVLLETDRWNWQAHRCPHSQHEEQGLNVIDATLRNAGRKSAYALEGGKNVEAKSQNCLIRG